MNQTLRNESTKSIILAPFNSTMSDLSGFFREMKEMAEMEITKLGLIEFSAKFIREATENDWVYSSSERAEYSKLVSVSVSATRKLL